jgi:hypothetical protein
MSLTQATRPARHPLPRPGDYAHPSSPGASASQSPEVASLLELQRTAGNAAVTGLVVAPIGVQRRKEPGFGSEEGGVQYPRTPATVSPAAGQPAGVAEHLLTETELADLPSVADTPVLLAENKALYAARDARRKAYAEAKKKGESPDPATKEFTAVEQARVDELNRKLKLRPKGDEEETLKANGITGGHAAWFAEVKAYPWLGKTIVCHRLLAERLAKAETELSGEIPPAGGWFTAAHSLRKVGESLHSFGMAIDINGSTNPYLLNPDAPNAQFVEATANSRAISDVINRAMLLVEAKTAAEADLQSRPANTDKDARALESYDKLQVASNALKSYMELDRPDKRAALDAFIVTLGAKDSRTAEKWIETIKADRKTLEAKASGKSWSSPQTGFLHLDRRLVKALTSSTGGGLTWLGDDTIGSGRDIMHFDMRGPGPIRKIVKTMEGKTIGLGSG